MRSIEKRIALGLGVTLLCTFILLAVFADKVIQQLNRDHVSISLQQHRDSLIRGLYLDLEQRWQLNPQYLAKSFQRVQSGYYYQVKTPKQVLRSRSLWEFNIALQPLVGTPQLHDFYPAPFDAAQISLLSPVSEPQAVEKQHWLIWQQQVTIKGQALTLWIAQDVNAFDQCWSRYRLYLYLVLGAVLLLLLVLQREILRRSMQNISLARNAIRQLQKGELSQLSEQVPLEIKPLIVEINTLLDQLQQRVSRSRTSMGNLAHELKRSLQTLQVLSNELPAHSTEKILPVLKQIQHLSERELKRAQISGSARPGQLFTVVSEFDGLVQVFSKIYPQIEIIIDTDVTGVLPFDRDDLLELLGNLLDNGCKYGESIVYLGLKQQDQHCYIEVVDDGEGVDQALFSELLKRGVKIDESKMGSGLGLSICQMIVDSYGGVMALKQLTQEKQEDDIVSFAPLIQGKPLSGLRVEVQLPLRQ